MKYTGLIERRTLAKEREIVVVVVVSQSGWKTSSIGFGAIKSIYRDSERERVHIYQQTNTLSFDFCFNTTIYLLESPISVHNIFFPSSFLHLISVAGWILFSTM